MLEESHQPHDYVSTPTWTMTTSKDPPLVYASRRLILLNMDLQMAAPGAANTDKEITNEPTHADTPNTADIVFTNDYAKMVHTR